MSQRFTVTFVPTRGIDAIKALRRTLKFALRNCGLRAIDAREEKGAPTNTADALGHHPDDAGDRLRGP
jgi:hypothetical protein